MPFTEQHDLFLASVRRFVQEEIEPHVDEWEERGKIRRNELRRRDRAD